MQPRDPTIRALTRDLVCAPDPQVRRIVATVDAMISRGPADALIEPLRQRLLVLRPPRPLRFERLLFHPLDPLIVHASHWKPEQNAIPRTALAPMADQVRLGMGGAAQAISAKIAGRTTADVDLIAQLGRSLWPAAGQILASSQMPQDWETTGLGDVIYRRLASNIAALLGRAVLLDILYTESASGRLPPDPEKIAAILGGIAAKSPAALPMLIALLLVRLPEAAALMIPARAGPEAVSIQTALDLAADRILQQLDEEEGVETRIATGTLADAGAAASRIATLLTQLEGGPGQDKRRVRLRAVRQRLYANCKARFTLGLHEDLLTPLQNRGAAIDPVSLRSMEAAARGLRVLEREARVVGSGASYDYLLSEAAEAVKNHATHDRLTVVDRIRLVEVLSGPDAALAMLEKK